MVIGIWSQRTGSVYEKTWNCAKKLHSANCWGGKKHCSYNKDEYANYKRGLDHKWKNA